MNNFKLINDISFLEKVIPFLSVMLTATEALAQDKVINLEGQFNDQICLQEGGSCHVFATTALIEAACERRTGKKIKLSEASLFASHLRQQFSKLPPNSRIVKNTENEITTVDGGKMSETMKLALANAECSTLAAEKDLPLPSFIEKLRDFAYRNPTATPGDGMAYLDKVVLSTQKVTLEGGAYQSANLSPEIQECLKTPLQYHYVAEPKESDLIEILSKNLPVMCAIEVIDENFKVDFHMNIVTGVNPGINGGNRFTVRDSNYPVPYYSEIYECRNLLYLE